jgi:hypothetical protein
VKPDVARVGTRMAARLNFLTKLKSSVDGIPGSLVTGWRNQLLAVAVLSSSAKANTVAVMGAAHLPGVGATLEANGFTLVDEQWFTAFGRASTSDEDTEVMQVANTPAL